MLSVSVALDVWLPVQAAKLMAAKMAARVKMCFIIVMLLVNKIVGSRFSAAKVERKNETEAKIMLNSVKRA